MKKQTLEERLELYVADKVSKDASPNALLLAASAVVGVGAILVPPPAEAAIVYSGLLQNNEVKKGQESYKVDFDNDANAEFTFKLSFVDYNGSTYSFTQKIGVDEVGTAAAIKNSLNNQPARLPSNYTVSSSKPFLDVDSSNLAASNTSVEGNFLDKQGFLGVKFEIGSNIHYGWIQYKANSDASVGTIIDWAYEDTPNKAIKAGATVSIDDDFDWNLFLPAILAGAKK